MKKIKDFLVNLCKKDKKFLQTSKVSCVYWDYCAIIFMDNWF